MDQQSILEGMLDRRSKELENLKIDRDSLLEKLKAAVEAKIQALSLLDEIQSKTIELDFKYVEYNIPRFLFITAPSSDVFYFKGQTPG